MALTGLQIYKLLPKTNCKDCGLPTCLAFAMKLAAKQVELDSCPYVSDESREKLAESAAPPVRLVTVSSDGREVKAGNEVVLFRHEKTFYNPCGLFVRLRDDEPLDKVKATGDAKVGVDIIRRAVIAPIKQIAENAGLDGSIVAQKVVESSEMNFGYDALRKEYGDMVKFGVIVSTKVERAALQNGASIASLLLTTDAIVSEIPEKKEPAPAMPPGGMGGMEGMM